MDNEKEWKNDATCSMTYRVTQGRGTVYARQYTLTMRLSGEQMDALQAVVNGDKPEEPRDLHDLRCLLGATLLSGEMIKLEKV